MAHLNRYYVRTGRYIYSFDWKFSFFSIQNEKGFSFILHINKGYLNIELNWTLQQHRHSVLLVLDMGVS